MQQRMKRPGQLPTPLAPVKHGPMKPQDVEELEKIRAALAVKAKDPDPRGDERICHCGVEGCGIGEFVTKREMRAVILKNYQGIEQQSRLGRCGCMG